MAIIEISSGVTSTVSAPTSIFDTYLVDSGGALLVANGGIVAPGFGEFDIAINNGGIVSVTSGGKVDGPIGNGGTLFVDSGGTVISTTNELGGVLFVDSGGTAINTTTVDGGREVISAGGTDSSA